MKFVLASHNKGKLSEMQEILGELGVEVVLQSELGLDLEPEETGETFLDNARIKARAVMEAGGLPAIADDSGLCVDALNGRPGVYSARYCGVHGDDEANNDLLLKEMDGKTDRTAHYGCAVALCRPGHEPMTAYGKCTGRILTERTGNGGFGYDPLFFSDDLQESFGTADPAAKNAISHRARAIQELLKKLEREA